MSRPSGLTKQELAWRHRVFKLIEVVILSVITLILLGVAIWLAASVFGGGV